MKLYKNYIEGIRTQIRIKIIENTGEEFYDRKNIQSVMVLFKDIL